MMRLCHLYTISCFFIGFLRYLFVCDIYLCMNGSNDNIYDQIQQIIKSMIMYRPNYKMFRFELIHYIINLDFVLSFTFFLMDLILCF